MINSSALKSSFCVFLLAASSGCAAFNPIEMETPESFLKNNQAVALTLATVAALAYAATPTETLDGSYDCSLDMFAKDPVTWARNVFGWRKKEGKWKGKPGQQPVFDPGYSEQGLVGMTTQGGKVLVTMASLAVLLKAIEPIMKELEILGAIKLKKA